MFAAPVAPPATAHEPARPKPPWGVKTPLQLDRWRYFLERLDKGQLTEPHLHVLHGIEHGFSYRSHKIIDKTYIYDNLPSTLAEPDVIDKAIAKETAAGRYLGPYTKSEVENFLGPFIAHPIGIVRKDEHSKPRLIEDLSHPHKGPVLSLNAQTDISGLTVNWGGMTRLVVKAKPGAQGATIDIEGAFRTIDVSPSEFWLGVIGWRERFHIDTATKFGGKGSSHMFEPPADTFCEIVEEELDDIDTTRWADDIALCCEPINDEPPYRYLHDTQDVVAIGNDLGFPFSRVNKFSPITKYIGFLWYWDTKVVELPKEKQERTRELVVKTQGIGCTNLKDVRSLCGKPSHIALIVPEGRVHLRSLWKMLTKMESTNMHPNTLWKFLDQQHDDLSWWDEYLTKPKVSMQLCTMRIPDDSLGLFCDASSSYGIGIVIDGSYDSLKFVQNWRTALNTSRDIRWAEALALELLITFLFEYRPLYNTHLLVHTDNTGVIGAWNKRSSRNKGTNTIIGRTLRILLRNQCFLSLVYIESAANPADAPSRGATVPDLTKKAFKGFPPAYKDILIRPT
jgi:hypothetical protein